MADKPKFTEAIVREDGNGQFHVLLRGGNHEVEMSSEQYTTREHAQSIASMFDVPVGFQVADGPIKWEGKND